MSDNYPEVGPVVFTFEPIYELRLSPASLVLDSIFLSRASHDILDKGDNGIYEMLAVLVYVFLRCHF